MGCERQTSATKLGLAAELIGSEMNDLETLERIENEFEESRKRETESMPAKGRSPDRPTLKIDEILGKSGGFGRYQVFLVLCLGLGGALYVSVQNLSMTFVETAAPWRCRIQSCATKTEADLGTVFYEMSKLCNTGLVEGEWEWINANHTAISDYNTACGSQTIVTNVLYFCPGVMIGGVLFGSMGWSTGRKTPFLSALLTSMVASVISAASREYILFIILRILLGASIAGYELLYFCWIVELVAKKWRPLAVGIQGIFGAIGLLVVLYINERWDYWRYKMVYVGIVSLVFIFVYAAVPESPYWLLAKGQDDVATTVLKRIAILNGKQYPDANPKIPSIKAREKVVSFFKPKYKRTGILLCINWFLVGMVYYHIFLTIDRYGDAYDAPSHAKLKNVNFILVLAVEMPAALVGAALLASVLGRKLAYLLNLSVFGVCVALSLVDYTLMVGWDVRRCAILVGAKWSVTSAKLILALWTAELAPTTIRSLMFGICLGASACGVVLSSALLFFGASQFVCVIVMISIAFVALIAALLIPDTRSWNLPDHLFDVFKNMNVDNVDAVYSDLQSEVQVGTML